MINLYSFKRIVRSYCVLRYWLILRNEVILHKILSVLFVMQYQIFKKKNDREIYCTYMQFHNGKQHKFTNIQLVRVTLGLNLLSKISDPSLMIQVL